MTHTQVQDQTTSWTGCSFRDPGGRLFVRNGRILRALKSGARGELEAFLDSPAGRRLMERGRVVPTWLLEAGEAKTLLGNPGEGEPGAAVAEHQPVPFQSYPFEWCPEMLHAAAILTLDLAEEVLGEGLGLKDATPHNVLFRGAQPVFVDLLSFERRDPHDPTWAPCAQFVRTFLLPLLLHRERGLPPGEVLLTRRDGLTPEDACGWLGAWRRLLPPALTLATIPAWLSRRRRGDEPGLYRPRRVGDPEQARFILRALFRRLRRTLRRLEPRGAARSVWIEYLSTQAHYTAGQLRAKEAFVERALWEAGPCAVLDVGANTGQFSVLAARHGAAVVAIDNDPAVVGRLWRRAAAEKLNILPLVVDLCRPTPAMGWRGAESVGFLERARGRFDLVLMLALIHHLLVSERVPLPEVLDLAAELTTSWLIIEYVDPADPMFRRLARGRDALHADLTPEGFEAACRRRFEIAGVDTREHPTRRLYLLRKR